MGKGPLMGKGLKAVGAMDADVCLLARLGTGAATRASVWRSATDGRFATACGRLAVPCAAALWLAALLLPSCFGTPCWAEPCWAELGEGREDARLGQAVRVDEPVPPVATGGRGGRAGIALGGARGGRRQLGRGRLGRCGRREAGEGRRRRRRRRGRRRRRRARRRRGREAQRRRWRRRVLGVWRLHASGGPSQDLTRYMPDGML